MTTYRGGRAERKERHPEPDCWRWRCDRRVCWLGCVALCCVMYCMEIQGPKEPGSVPSHMGFRQRDPSTRNHISLHFVAQHHHIPRTFPIVDAICTYLHLTWLKRIPVDCFIAVALPSVQRPRESTSLCTKYCILTRRTRFYSASSARHSEKGIGGPSRPLDRFVAWSCRTHCVEDKAGYTQRVAW